MSNESVEQWAQTLEPEEPLKLGVIEKELLSRPLSAEPVKVEKINPIKLLINAIPALIIVVLPLVSFLLLWLAHSSDDFDAQDNLRGFASFAALVGATAPVAPLMIWLQNKRRRNAFTTIAASVVAPIAIVASGLIWLTGVPMTGAVAFWNLLGLALSIVLLASLFFSKPKPTDLEEIAREKETKARLRERTIVLRVLHERGLIDAELARKALPMELGSWHELDK